MKRRYPNADNGCEMNGFGVGAAVAIGIEIGATRVSPELGFSDVLMLMFLFGAIIGYIFQLWRMALTGARPPFRRS